MSEEVYFTLQTKTGHSNELCDAITPTNYFRTYVYRAVSVETGQEIVPYSARTSAHHI